MNNNLDITQRSSITLPGYEAQLNDDGVAHSKQKVENSANELVTNNLVGRNAITMIPCSKQSETLSYRSTVAFQVITNIDDNNNNSNINNTNTNTNTVHYAMRQNRKAVFLCADYFPIATPRIQNVMKLVMKAFNTNGRTENFDQENEDEDEEAVASISSKFEYLKTNLSSVSFVSSWNCDMDCIVTFNYDKPMENERERELEAEALCSKCGISTLILRSKKKKIVAGSRKDHPYIRDKVYISITNKDNLEEITTYLDKEVGMEGRHCSSAPSKVITVQYEKPQDAFQHPNHNAMLHALEWMLTRLRKIRSDYGRDNNKVDQQHPLNLLEMYCGCGAHTMAIAKAEIFHSITTVELDNRLVEACRKNAKINGCTGEQCSKQGRNTPINIFQGDAGDWSRKYLKHFNKSEPSLFNKVYQVLLVDPPRSGLDRRVCELAKTGSFEHIIYISCGREALKGDILELSDMFEVIDCTILDLFPRTDSVESLVHLQRKSNRESNKK